MAKFIFMDPEHGALAVALCEASGVTPSSVRRLVLDLEVGSVAKLYLETYADEAILDVDLPAGIVVTEAEAA